MARKKKGASAPQKPKMPADKKGGGAKMPPSMPMKGKGSKPGY